MYVPRSCRRATRCSHSRQITTRKAAVGKLNPKWGTAIVSVVVNGGIACRLLYIVVVLPQLVIAFYASVREGTVGTLWSRKILVFEMWEKENYLRNMTLP